MLKWMLIAALVITPGSVLAASIYETECREEMNLTGVELQPGTRKAKLRSCIRNKASAARNERQSMQRKPPSSAVRNALAKQRFQRNRDVTLDELRKSQDRRCREKLGIQELELIRPGPMLGRFNSCLKQLRSEASRDAKAATRNRKGTVYRRTKQLGEAVKQLKEGDESRYLQRLYDLRRTRSLQRTRADFRTLKKIRDATRARSYSRERTDSRAEQRSRANDCRGVAPREWAACIREAMGTE